MPCPHKFQHHLRLQQLSYEPETLIVGTFNPSWPDTNRSGWFYGNTTGNYFWDVLPRLYGEPSLLDADATAWQQFCEQHHIALTDLIDTIDDADASQKGIDRVLASFSDEALSYHFEDFVFVDIVDLLRKHPSIKNVYFTRGITEAFWRHLWNLVIFYCEEQKIHERRLLTPAISAASEHHAAHNLHQANNVVGRLQDYLLMRWQAEWHF
ncbi:MAG: hypothetical protein EBZ77_06540 [Chitinophagia bacterium]|nr:hypothetical protein [Chitinophagia bacterium]